MGERTEPKRDVFDLGYVKINDPLLVGSEVQIQGKSKSLSTFLSDFRQELTNDGSVSDELINALPIVSTKLAELIQNQTDAGSKMVLEQVLEYVGDRMRLNKKMESGQKVDSRDDSGVLTFEEWKGQVDTAPEVKAFNGSLEAAEQAITTEKANVISNPHESFDAQKLVTSIETAKNLLETGYIGQITVKIHELFTGVDNKLRGLASDEARYLDAIRKEADGVLKDVFKGWKESVEQYQEVVDLRALVVKYTTLLPSGDTTADLLVIRDGIYRLQNKSGAADKPEYKEYVEQLLKPFIEDGGMRSKLLVAWEASINSSNGEGESVKNAVVYLETTLFSKSPLRVIEPSDIDWIESVIGIMELKFNQPSYTKEQSDIWSQKYMGELKKIEGRMKRLLKENEAKAIQDSERESREYKLSDLRKWLLRAEGSNQYMSDSNDDTIRTSSAESTINEEVTDPERRTSYVNELNARAALNDVAKVFGDAQFYPDRLKSGYGYINGNNFETLFHHMEGVRELVPLALTLYELALRGKFPLPGFQDCKAATWGIFKNQIQAEIAKLLGKEGSLAASMADRLVTGTGMIPYYEDEFAYTRKMVMRDVGKIEMHRQYYGDTSRLEGAGIRAHGPDSTVGKYWNDPDAVIKKGLRRGVKINPVWETTYEEGEPRWDQFSDFWNNTPLIDGKTLVYEDGKLVTLSRNNRYRKGEIPNFSGLTDLLSPSEISRLESFDWSHAVRYMDMHFTKHDRKGRTVGIKDEAMNEFIEQMQAREGLSKLILKADWSAKDFDPDWFDEKKTAFDYLAVTGHVIRDISDPKIRNDQLRRFQTVFLLGVMRDHAPGIAMQSDWWEPEDMLIILDRALMKGFINNDQMVFLENELNLNQLIGPLRKAVVIQINRKALAAMSKLK